MAKKRPTPEDETSEEYRLPIRVKVEHNASYTQQNVATEEFQQRSEAAEAVQHNELSEDMTFSQSKMESDETAQMMQCDEILTENAKPAKRRKRKTPRGKRGKRRNRKSAAMAAEAQEDEKVEALEAISSRNTEMITKPERPPIEGEGRRLDLEYAEKIVQLNWGDGSNASLQDIIGPDFFASGPERKTWTAIRALSGRTTLEKAREMLGQALARPDRPKVSRHPIQPSDGIVLKDVQYFHQLLDAEHRATDVDMIVVDRTHTAEDMDLQGMAEENEHTR